MIGIVDYGVGNIFSIKKSIDKIGEKGILINDPKDFSRCEKLILPGVGAFGDAVSKLRSSGMLENLMADVDGGKPILGICLGMQLLMTESEEYGIHHGLDILKGRVKPIEDMLKVNTLKIPHIGWNSLELTEMGKKSPIFKYIENGDYVYFVHSYSCVDCDESLLAYSDYSYPVTAVVGRGNIYGVQFHPEKSGEVGLAMLKAFAEL